MVQRTNPRNLEEVRARIARAARCAGRSLEDVRLVAVTKKSSPEWIKGLIACGVFDLGENYPQELWRKSDAPGGVRRFDSLAPDWTLANEQGQENTSPGQDDSCRRFTQAFTSARTRLPPRWPTRHRFASRSTRRVKRASTAGRRARSSSDCESIAACRSIPVVGLMTMAALGSTDASARASFARLRETRDVLRRADGLAVSGALNGDVG